MEFSTYRLLIGENITPRFKDLHAVFNNQDDSEDHLSRGDTYHIIKAEFLHDNKYFWLSVNFGRTSPHPGEIINTNNHKPRHNTREEYEVEPSAQFFALYSFHSRTLYMTRYEAKHTVFEEYLKKKLNKPVEVAPYLKGKEHFKKMFASVKEIELFGHRNLFNSEHPLDIIDVSGKGCGLDKSKVASYKITLDLKYSGNAFFSVFEKIVDQTRSGVISAFTCKGENRDGFSAIFNEDNFTKKIEIKGLAKKSDGFYEPKEVSKKLIESIEIKEPIHIDDV